MPRLGITKGISQWNTQDSSVERFTDNAAYTSAHPDDTLVLAGPPRFIDEEKSTYLAIGMLQGFQFSSQKPTQPLQAIGSGRLFFVSGKSQTSWNIGRLFCNGRNLNRVLYHNAVMGGLDVKGFDDSPVSGSNEDMYYINLDSELYYIPFGLAAIFRDKGKDLIGSVYLELSMIQSYGVGFNAGQNMIMENVSGMCDRVFPWHPAELAVVASTDDAVRRQTMDTVTGFISGRTMNTDGTINEINPAVASSDSEIA
jgi:hypothetical protein